MPKALLGTLLKQKQQNMITTVSESCEHTKTVGKSVDLTPNKRFSLMPFKLGMMISMMLT